MHISLFCRITFFLVLALANNSPAVGQILEKIHSFDGTDGATPESSLILSANGSFYGVTRLGGTHNLGTAFQITPEGAFTSLVSFNGTNGSNPRCKLLESSDGLLYGTTMFGGDSNEGTVFKLTTNGVLTTLASFGGINGKVPYAGLTEGTNGAFYGTTFGFGGTTPNVRGTIFRVTREGVLTTIKSFPFNDPNGRTFYAGLTLANDGNFYGADAFGGTPPNDKGTIYRVSHEGNFNVIFSFSGTNGRGPVGTLTLGSDNQFYGSTAQGGTNNYGTLFRITTNGQLTTLHHFSSAPLGIGHTPEADLLRDDNGDLYGVTHYPDTAGGWGSVFKLTTDGVMEQLALFDSPSGPLWRAGVIKGSDGHLYGQSPRGGTFSNGFVYRIITPILLSLFQAGNELVLSWPTNAVGYKLESTLDLNSSIDWIVSTNLPVVLGAEYVVTNSIQGVAQFYRLKQ